MNADDVGIPNCPAAQVVPLTDNKKALKDEVATFTDGGYTAGHLGTAWAQYLLSPDWASLYPAASAPTAYNKPNVQKIALLMTDGDYNTFNTKSGAENVSPEAIASIKAAIDTCTNMKANGITIYTIGFQAPAAAQLTLAACASDASKAINASNGDQLRSAFKNIANQITTLRLTQ
jgi:von Willebrand factor type A domain